MVYHGGVIERGFSLNKWVDITSTASAKLFGMFPKKGTIAVGIGRGHRDFRPVEGAGTVG